MNMTDPTRPDYAGPCTHCGGPVPSAEPVGKHVGATLSRLDRTYVCSGCGDVEALPIEQVLCDLPTLNEDWALVHVADVIVRGLDRYAPPDVRQTFLFKLIATMWEQSGDSPVDYFLASRVADIAAKLTAPSYFGEKVECIDVEMSRYAMQPDQEDVA